MEKISSFASIKLVKQSITAARETLNTYREEYLADPNTRNCYKPAYIRDQEQLLIKLEDIKTGLYAHQMKLERLKNENSHSRSGNNSTNL